MQLSGASPLPHLTDYLPWNAVKCGRGLAPDGNTQPTQNSSQKNAPACRPGHFLLSYTPHLTDYLPWNAVKCGRELAPDGNTQPKKCPSLSTRAFPIELHPPHLTDYLPWNAVKCRRELAPDGNTQPTQSARQKKAPACRPGHFLLSYNLSEQPPHSPPGQSANAQTAGSTAPVP
jgi:hypothetical protein